MPPEEIGGIDEVGARRAVDISPGIGQATSLNDIIKQSAAQSVAVATNKLQDVRQIARSGELSDPNVMGLFQKSVLIYNNTVGFVGTVARKLVGAVETLLRS